MITAFYVLYILVTPARWSWLWFAISIMMNIWQFLRRQEVVDAINKLADAKEDNSPTYRGPF